MRTLQVLLPGSWARQPIDPQRAGRGNRARRARPGDAGQWQEARLSPNSATAAVVAPLALDDKVSDTEHRYLGELLVARTGPGDLRAIGRCIAQCNAPTVTIRTPDGQQIHWRADLCQIVPVADDALEALLPLQYLADVRQGAALVDDTVEASLQRLYEPEKPGSKPAIASRAGSVEAEG